MKKIIIVTLCCLAAPTMLLAQDLKQESTRVLDESKVPAYTLPDPLLCENGQRVTTVEQWEKQRRPELFRLVTTYMYGKAPVLQHPLQWQVDSLDTNYQFVKGKKERRYTRKIVTIYLTQKKADGPYPYWWTQYLSLSQIGH